MNSKIKWDVDEDDCEEDTSWRKPNKKKQLPIIEENRGEHKKKEKPFVRRDKWTEETK